MFKTNKRKNKIQLFSKGDDFKSARRICGSRIEMYSNREISVDGCRGILEYNDLYVKLKTREGELMITGKRLNIPVFDGPLITVSGIIDSLEFSHR